MVVLMVLCCLPVHTLWAAFNPQKLYLRNVNLRDGLSQIVVTDMTMDKNGFLWAGTFDGLNRYDGSSIKVYRPLSSDSNSLPSSTINRVYADHHHHLYLLTSAGFCIFDCRTERVVRPEFLRHHEVVWVTRHGSDALWVYTRRQQLLLVNNRTWELIQSIQLPKASIPFCDLNDLREIGGSLYLVSTCGQVWQYRITEHTFRSFTPPNHTENKFSAIGVDREQNLFITSPWNDFLYFDTRAGLYKRPDYLPPQVSLLGVNGAVFDSLNNLLYLPSYGQGLFVYDYEHRQIIQCKKGDSRLNLSGNYLLNVVMGRQGMMYIGYDGVGIDAINPFVRQFVPLVLDDSTDSRSIRFVRKIVEDDAGNILIGTAGSGLVRYRPLSGKFEFFPMLNRLSQTSNFVIEMIKSGSEVWLGFNGSGLAIVDQNTLKVKKLLGPGVGPNQLISGTIWSLLDDELGNIWVGTRESGIQVVNKRDFSMATLSDVEVPEFKLNGIRTLFLTRSKKILAGTEKGLYVIDRLTHRVTKVYPSPGKQSAETEQSIKCIYQDSEGNLWLGTNGGGIHMLDSSYHKIHTLSTESGLLNNVVYGILPQNAHSLWVSTNMGLSNIRWSQALSRADIRFTIRHYDEQNGLQSNEFNTGAYASLSGKRLVFGGLNGLNIFHPDSVRSVIASPSVYIAELKIFENPYRSDTAISYLRSVQLQPYENSISLGFNTLGFALPDKTKFQYRLLGYDKNWIYANNRNYVSYTNLNPGTYEFQVRASLSEADWDNNYTSLQLFIATPYYRTWWFISGVLMTLMSVVYALYRYRMRQIREKEMIRLQYTKELADVEMKALRAQINPHFLFNSLNSINNFILRNDTEKASRYLVKFSQLVRNILNHSSAPFINLEEEINTIELYMLIEGMRFNNQFSYQIELDKEINPAVIKIPSLLLQPYVENAIWHGLLHKEGEKTIRISIQKESDHAISIHIEDNGVGREEARKLEQKTKKHKSFGMKIGENRLRLMNVNGEQVARVEVTDLYSHEIPAGTRIRIIIPADIYKEDPVLFN